MKTIYYFLENITKKIYNRTLLSNNVTFLKQYKIWKGREREENWWLQFFAGAIFRRGMLSIYFRMCLSAT